MQELIDRQSALSVCKEYGWIDDEDFIEGYNTAIKDIREAIKELPTNEYEPVRHGRWAKAADKQYCTNCRAVTKVCNAPFCWHCGAQMDLRTSTEVQLDEADSVMMGGADNG